MSRAIPSEARTAVVSLDGVMVLTVDSDRQQKKREARARGQADKGPSGWKEASVGVISFYDANGDRLDTHRYGRMPEAGKLTTKAWLRAELAHVRAVRPELTIVALADGAANNWKFFKELDVDEEVVDYFHTVEHLHRHVNKANGASTVHTQAVLTSMRRRLMTEPGAATAIATELQEMRERAGTQAVSTTKSRGKRQPTYFERHHERMDYPRLKQANLPIGSGVTESTCKLLLCDRLRRTGMRWTQNGGQAVLTLRAWRISGCFDHAWKLLMEENRDQLAA